MIELELTPPRPYRLADAVGGRDPTRRSGGGVLELALRTAAGPARARVWQRLDGTLGVRLTRLRRRARRSTGSGSSSRPTSTTRRFSRWRSDDQLLAPLVRRRRALRPSRCATFAQALVRALAGQLIPAVEAARIERRVLGAISGRHDGLRVPPGSDELRAAERGDGDAAAASRRVARPR